MYYLIFDTSTERGFVSIAQNNTLVFREILPFGLQNSKFLLPCIIKGLKEVGITLCDVGAIGVGVGPGSFTGIRIGVTTAKAISYAKKIPLIGFNTLATFVSKEKGRFASLIDAKSQGAYLLLQERKEGKIEWVEEPFLAPISSLKEALLGCQTIIGPNLGRFQLEKGIESDPSPNQALEMVMKSYSEGIYSKEGEISLTYLKEPLLT